MSTTAAPPLTADERRRLIAERKQRSLYWRLVHLLGSLKLALFLLATIAIACAVATFYESSFNAKIARAYIYKAPWFIFWLALLCINLFAVTLTRWPWQKKHTGFIITHYGIILLLIGAVIGSQLGFEGNVTLHKGGEPVGRITTSRSVLQVESPADGALYLVPFDADLALPSERHPKTLDVPGSELRIVADAHSDRLVDRELLTAAGGGGPGISVKFTTAMMGQTLILPFVIRPDGGMERDLFGLAKVAFLPRLPERPSGPATETQMVFAKFAPVIPDGSERTGVTVTLSENGETITATTPDGKSASHPRQEVAGKSFQVGEATVNVVSYWPDFKLENGQPTSVSDEPNNPAVLVRITGPAATDPASSQPMLEMAPTDSGIAYQLSRDGRIYEKGIANVGTPFALGWADWQATIEQFLPNATIATESGPGPEGVEGVPGFRAHLRAPDGTTGPAQWVKSGALTTLQYQDTFIRVGYGLELRPVPFTIALKNFEVPLLEGTETPSNFIATVEFRDKKTGETKEGVAKMNHPASWPGDPLALITGLNYKFSQAQWNPQDLDETTLQVLYDPGWLLKWIGSLAICVGIFIMFYIRPKKS